MRRIVTGHTDDGRSTVVADDQLADAGMAELWRVEPGTPAPSAGAASPAEAIGIEPAPGGTAWYVVTLPPEDVMRAALAGGVPGVDANGWHRTDTTDLVMVMAGPVVLQLDTGEVELAAGDCVVQQATRHAWWNRAGGTAGLACVVLRSAAV